jgi:mycothiol system anti-sigma-R factor
MNCKVGRQFLDTYLDGELEVEKRLELEQHLNECPDCQKLLEEQQKFRTFFNANAPFYTAPDDLRSRVRTTLEAQVQKRKIVPLFRQPWLYAAAFLVLSLCLAWPLLFPGRDRYLVYDAALDHSRAKLLGRLYDVNSADPDVVRDWLTAKLGFTPPVVRPSDPQVQMQGGRVGVVRDRKVAAVVYKKNQDLISLFVWPAGNKPLPEKDWSVNGYQACTWNAANSNFVAISTLSDHDLDAFIDQIRDQLK